MRLFDKYKQQSALNRVQEERLYAFVSEEFKNGETRTGLYAQALVEAEGDEKKAGAIYIKLRVQSLKDEYTIQQLIGEKYRQERTDFSTVAARDKLFKDFFYNFEFDSPYDFLIHTKSNKKECVLNIKITYEVRHKSSDYSGNRAEVLIEFDINLRLDEIILDPKNKSGVKDRLSFDSDKKAKKYIATQIQKCLKEFHEFQGSGYAHKYNLEAIRKR